MLSKFFTNFTPYTKLIVIFDIEKDRAIINSITPSASRAKSPETKPGELDARNACITLHRTALIYNFAIYAVSHLNYFILQRFICFIKLTIIILNI